MFAFLPLATIAHQGDLTLVYERSGFLDTGSYAEAVWFCRRLSDLAPKRAKLISFGTSPEGRDMVALVVSKDGEFEPEQLSKSSRPLVYIENGIHSGEIEGKDATLILLRDILVGKKHEALLDAANLLVVPVFGLDAHERSSKYNRINQNGPREQGWRASGQNLNLNRDFIKADGGEMRAMIGLMHRFRPDFCFDNHTTDGANYPYQLHLGIPHWHTLDAGVAAWAAEMERAVTAQL
ncbi:MAG: peptidase M14, partial [Fimbriimonas ginsengisoli]|nr:peptidase M14 [Fimbriimonas ginsengisoli]